MRSVFILLFFCLVGYMAYQYVSNPVPVVPPPPRAKVAHAPVPEETVPVVPDLSRVAVKDGAPLTHARVKEVRTSGIVFVADQGLFKVTFDRLPAEYEAYYGPMAAEDPAPAEAPAAEAAAAASTPPAAKPRPQRNALEDAQAELAYVQRKAAFEDQMSRDRDTIDHWYKQSSFDRVGVVSQSQFEVAQADYALATVQLAQLEAAGP